MGEARSSESNQSKYFFEQQGMRIEYACSFFFFRFRIQDFRFLRVIDLDWKHGYEMIRGNWCSSMKSKKITSLLTGDKGTL